MKKGNIVFGLLLLFIMCFLLYLTYQIPKPMSEYEMGAGYVPSVYLYTAIALLITIIIREFLKTEERSLMVNLRTIMFFVIVVAYVIGIRFIGYYIPTLIVLAILLFILGERRKYVLLSVPIGFSVFIFIVFQQILNVRI